MSRSIKVEIAWSAKLANPFRIGVSKIGGTDKLTGLFGSTAYDDLTSATKQSPGIAIRRGRTQDVGPMAAGECSVTLNDPSGTYNPYNASGPLYGKLVPARRVRVREAVGGVVYPLFDGFVRRIEPDPARDRQETRIECIDLFGWLNRVRPTIASTGPTTTGAAIGLILDACGWTEGSMRDLDVGDDLSDFSADGTQSALALIQNLIDAELGAFFISAAGAAVYEDRRAIWRAPRDSVQAALTGGFRTALPTVDWDGVQNRASVTREGGTAQVYTDDASALQYGTGDAPAVSTPYLADDAQAMRLARWIVSRSKDATGPLREVMLVNRDDTALAVTLARDLQDRVSLSEAYAGTSFDGHIQGIEHRIAEGGAFHQTIWRLSRRPPVEPFRIGISKIGGGHVLSY
jgi:hypothetical protein